MVLENLLSGESKNIEYKQEIANNSKSYMKTVVAFANGEGGKILFGVEDESMRIIGVDKDSIFQAMDAITNAISDSCFPMIIPDITVQEVDNKAVIVVEITAGMQRPYYIKSLGMKDGTFIRTGGTTRLADPYILKELILEGENRFFDRLSITNMHVSESDIGRLCEKLREIACANSSSDEEKAAVKTVTLNTLLSWGVLIEQNGELFPTNAYALLTNQQNLPPAIQCAVFKDDTRTVFIDRREIGGTIQEQVEAVYQYILGKINLGVRFKGIYRQDVYELPPNSIRELVANAIVHRSYIEPGHIQVALYDNRLEITSPGMLLRGVTIEKMKAGYSKIRNRAIASAFAYMKFIEQWGSGIPRIMKECREYGLQDPELIDFDGDFRINLYRNVPNHSHTVVGTIGTNHGTIGTNHDTILHVKENMSSDEQQVLHVIMADSKVTQRVIQQQTHMSLRSIKRIMSELQRKGIILRKGNNRSGEWIVKE
ncbi:Predicted transcriptional regulator, contains HTH domain [Megasphaera paucivorans]|uniref:Predicted transcriptional regulator, contains HTH domain n=3 Tax=Megasphaera TaxID=906 RepID=A0A1H0A0Q0_9FIRM|nr:RNA-binding domain-containing protein [Megasphaera paucivorans]SDN26533.1 Predicted transcriptional regulator, contains HTH domain [Megasphaera paucivorans]